MNIPAEILFLEGLRGARLALGPNLAWEHTPITQVTQPPISDSRVIGVACNVLSRSAFKLSEKLTRNRDLTKRQDTSNGLWTDK